MAGVLFMLVAERRLASRVLNANPPAGLHPDPIAAQHGIELRGPQQTGGKDAHVASASRMTRTSGPHQRRIYLFIFAFVVGEISRGISVGNAAMMPPWTPDNARDKRILSSLPGPLVTYILKLLTPGIVRMNVSPQSDITDTPGSSYDGSRLRNDAPLGFPYNRGMQKICFHLCHSASIGCATLVHRESAFRNCSY